ncbi:TBC-domain-containing protein [Acaromyces ingoldii]|uniref:TBC-domain-containing protein n=1 Tax=Acaromyces ingoldii TaxID=215250 RepID=A0A316YG92_9BASI|nr:TBC-domain-containing protein [Acaromyces ingoldii]PWN88151.1 TBC-domain-containing protein [Acaromyces ingoldii]
MDQANQPWQRFFARHAPPPPKANAGFFPSRRGQAGPSASSSGSSGGHLSAATMTSSPRRAMSARNLRGSREKDAALNSKGAASLLPSSSNRAVKNEAEYEECRRRLRRLVLIEGVPTDDFRVPGTDLPSRPLVWKILLDVRSLDPACFLSLVARGPSPLHDKISNDAFRTLATDASFKKKVDEAMLIRLLDSFVWRYWDESNEARPLFSYVQGMNVLAAPFLYVMPSEVEAFECFCTFIEKCCPTYVQPTLAGVHRGLELLDRCLQSVDPSLYNHLRSKNLTSELYGFASVLTLCGCTPPLTQTLQLWDFLLAFGAHLSIVCIVAQLLLIRDELVSSAQPMKLLRQFPDLDAKSVVGIATTLVRDLDDDLYDELVTHMVEL